MQIALSPELEQFIQSQVASGIYGSASEVIQAGLRSLQQQREQSRSQLLQEVDLGFQALDRGAYVEYASAEAAATDLKVRARRIQERPTQ